MKKSIPFWIFLLLSLSYFFFIKKEKSNDTLSQYDYYVKVVGISDGDTFTGLTEDNEQIKFRIYGIDAPEKKQAFGTKSKQYLSDMIYNEQVGIIIKKKVTAMDVLLLGFIHRTTKTYHLKCFGREWLGITSNMTLPKNTLMPKILHKKINTDFGKKKDLFHHGNIAENKTLLLSL